MKGSGKQGKVLLSDLRPDWREIIISEFKEGASKTEVEALLDITPRIRPRLYRDEDEFAEVWDHGVSLCKAWWLRQGRIQIHSRNFNSTLWYMNMKNRFGWKDKQDLTSNNKAVSGVILLPPKRKPAPNKKQK